MILATIFNEESWSWCNCHELHGNIRLESTAYNKFKRFSNVADEISAKLLSSFLEYEVPVVIPDRYDIEFSIKAAERKGQTETQLICRKLELLINEKVPMSYQCFLGN